MLVHAALVRQPELRGITVSENALFTTPQRVVELEFDDMASMERYFERVETVVNTMLADPEVRLPGARRFAAEKTARAQGLEIPEDLLAQIEKLAQQPG